MNNEDCSAENGLINKQKEKLILSRIICSDFVSSFHKVHENYPK